MALSHQQDTKNEMSFFTSLRRLGRELDQGVTHIQGQLDARNLKSCDNRHLALKCLRDHKKDIESVKANARGLLKEVRHRGSEFEQSLQACGDIIEVQLRQLASIHSHLTQYGFVPKKNVSGDNAEENASPAVEVEPDVTPSTPPEQSSQKEEMEKKCKMTPCLEDYGLSSYTLNVLSRPRRPQTQQASTSVSTSVPPERKVSVQVAAPEQDSLPVIFQNQGLVVTPSCFSQPQVMDKGTDGKSDHVPFSLFWDQNATADEPKPPQMGMLDGCDSPIPPVLQTPGVKQIPHLGQAPDPPVQVGMAKMADSPEIPVLQTPGVKQIPHLGQASEPPSQGDNKSRVARKLKLGGDSQTIDSPVPPILRTPGMKQISTKNSAVATVHPYSKAPYQLDLPPTPEMTFSLKDLQGMTVSFSHADLSSAYSEKSALTIDFDASGTTQAGAFSRHSLRSRNMSPPTRHGPGIRSSRAEVPESQKRWASGRSNAESVDFPASPELTLSYSCMPLTKSSHSAVSVSDHVSRLGAEKRGVMPEPKMSSWTKDRFNTKAVDLPTSPELTMSYGSKIRTNAVSHTSRLAADSHGALPEPQLSSLTKDRFNTRAVDLPTSPELTLSYNSTRTNAIPLPTSHRSRIATESHGAEVKPQLSGWAKDSFSAKAVDMPASPELTVSYGNKTRTDAASYKSKLVMDCHGALPEPQLSSWTKDRVNTKAVDLPTSPELTMSYGSKARIDTASHRSRLAMDSCGALPEPQLSSLTKHRFNTKAVDLPTSPELTMSYSSKARIDAASHRSRLAMDSCGALPQPQLSSLTKHRFNSMAVDLPTSPELTKSYSRMVRSQAQPAPSSDTCKPDAKSKDIHSEHDESYFSCGGPDSQKESGTGNYSKGLHHVSDVPPSKENIVHLGQQEMPPKGRTSHNNVSKQLFLPNPPRVQRPLTDSLNLDFPSTPNFLGSYHFMGSQK